MRRRKIVVFGFGLVAIIFGGCTFESVDGIPVDGSRDGKIHHFTRAQEQTSEVTLPVIYARPPQELDGAVATKPSKWKWLMGLTIGLVMTGVALHDQNQKLRQELAQLREEHDKCLAHTEAEKLKRSFCRGMW